MQSGQLQEVTWDEIRHAFRCCIKRKTGTENAIRFMMHRDVNLYRLMQDLNNGSYEIGRSVTFVVHHPKDREVFAADFRDRVVHHLVINRIAGDLEKELIANSFSCRIGLGTSAAARECYSAMESCSYGWTKEGWILKCDIQSFFMSIDKTLLYDRLLRLIDGRKDYRFLSRLLHTIVFNAPERKCVRKQNICHWKNLPRSKSLFGCPHGKGLPIGNLTSQNFANLFLSDFDHFVSSRFRYYGRYVDDFYIVDEDKERLKSFVPCMRDELARIGLTLHPNKIVLQPIRHGVEFVGVILKPGRKYIGGRVKSGIWKVLNAVDTCDDLRQLESRANSYLGFMHHHNTYKLRRKFVRTLCEKLKEKKISITINKDYMSVRLSELVEGCSITRYVDDYERIKPRDLLGKKFTIISVEMRDTRSSTGIPSFIAANEGRCTEQFRVAVGRTEWIKLVLTLDSDPDTYLTFSGRYPSLIAFISSVSDRIEYPVTDCEIEYKRGYCFKDTIASVAHP